MTIAKEHGWGTHRILAPAVAAGAVTLTWLGRFDEAQGWLDRVERAQPDSELEPEPILHHARGFLRLGQGRYGEALEGVPGLGEDASRATKATRTRC